MRTTLTLAALAGCTAAATATAQTSVTLYGIADASARYVNGLDATNRPGAASLKLLSSGVNRTSRWGLRGREDLGGGMRAVFNVESGFNIDTGAQADAAKFFDRAAVVGLEGGFGGVMLGRQTTLLADTLGTIDPLAIRFAGFNPNVQFAALSAHGLGSEFGSTASTTGSYRLDNSVKYSVDAGPATLKAMYGFGEATGGDRKAWGLGVGVRGGGFAAQAAGMKLKSTAGRELDAWIAGGQWRGSGFGVRASYAGSGGDTSATAKTRYRTASAGVSAQVTSQLELIVGAYDLRRERTGLADDGFRRLISFLEYSLSKRTVAYLEGDYTRWRDGYQGAGAKGTGKSLSVGVVHNF